METTKTRIIYNDKDLEAELLNIAKMFRNCRKIENRINQLQKQLYLGQKAAYAVLMKLMYPNHEEHLKTLQDKFENGRSE